jgi:sulfopyruvate decarboxylase TPP-binding subunit
MVNLPASFQLDDLAASFHDWASMSGIAECFWLKQKNHHGNYDSLFLSGKIESILEFLSQVDLPRNTLKHLNKVTAIPLGILCSWRGE